jgi:hypothetical protein
MLLSWWWGRWWWRYIWSVDFFLITLGVAPSIITDVINQENQPWLLREEWPQRGRKTAPTASLRTPVGKTAAPTLQLDRDGS